MKSATPEEIRSQFDKAHPPAIRAPTVDAIASGKKIEETDAMTDAVSRYELDAKLETIEARMDARIGRIEESNVRIESSLSSLKTTMIVTAISSVLAIAAINIGVIQTMFGAFESGKTTATAISEAANQLKQTQEDLRAIKDRLDENARSQMVRTPDQNK